MEDAALLVGRQGLDQYRLDDVARSWCLAERCEAALHPVGHLIDQMPQGEQHQPFLGREIVLDQMQQDARFGGDRAQCGGVQTAFTRYP